MDTPTGTRRRRRNAASREEESRLAAAVGQGLDPQRLWQLLRRRRFYLLLPLVVIGAVVGAGLQTITPVYMSTSSLQIEDRGSGSQQLDRLLSTPAMQRLARQNRLSVVREKIASEELLLRVIRNLRLREDPDVIAEATLLQQQKLPDQTVSVIAERILVGRLRKKISVNGSAGDIYYVSVEDNDPTTAYKLNESITQAFIDQVMREGNEALVETSAFTDEQLQQAMDDLEAAQDALEEFKRQEIVETELSGNPVNQQNSRWAENLVRLAALDREETGSEYDDTRTRLLSRGLTASPLVGILEDTDVQNVKERLRTLEREDYLRQLQTGTESVRRTALTPERQRIGVARNRLNELLNELVAEYYSEQPADIRADYVQLHELALVEEILAAHEAQISREYRVYVGMIQDQPQQEAELRRLEQAVTRAEEHWQTLLSARRSGETTQGAMDSGFGTVVRTLEAAKKPLFPAKPNKTKIALMAAMLALGIGMGAVFLAEYVDTSFKDVQEVAQHTGLEVLGTLPRFAGEFEWEAQKRRASLAWRTAFVVTLVAVMAALVLYYKRSTVQDRVHLVTPVESVSGPGAR